MIEFGLGENLYQPLAIQVLPNNQFDVSLPLKDLYTVPEAVIKRLKESNLVSNAPEPIIDCVSFGHVGDGNIHLCIAKTEYARSIEDTLIALCV